MHLLIMGAPGSGKGTAADYLKKYFSIPHISTGDIFRKAIAEGTELGVIAKQFIDDGHLVPDELTCAIVKERLSNEDCKCGFLLDGFPRTLKQAQALSIILNELNITLDAAINLDIEYDVLKTRIINRRICSKCGKGYNLISHKPQVEGICDDCGGSLFQRVDDVESTIENRFNIYNTQTKPILAYYEELGILKNIDGSKSIDEVNQAIVSVLEDK